MEYAPVPIAKVETLRNRIDRLWKLKWKWYFSSIDFIAYYGTVTSGSLCHYGIANRLCMIHICMRLTNTKKKIIVLLHRSQHILCSIYTFVHPWTFENTRCHKNVTAPGQEKALDGAIQNVFFWPYRLPKTRKPPVRNLEPGHYLRAWDGATIPQKHFSRTV